MSKALATDHLQIVTPRGEEAPEQAFYGRLPGMAELPKHEPLTARGSVWLQCGPQQVHLGAEVDFRPAKNAHPAFVAGDLEALAKKR